ncbi:MAG: hypothetical protein E7034_03065 [Akkermansiaceae bacterium]|nr:hypothetical protein [Akkermansiaceae bacterium]
MKRYIQIVLALATLVLQSCYFNSAGHIFDKISYNAEVKMSEATGCVLHDEYADEYYLSDMRFYRVGKPVKTQYSAWDSDKRKSVSAFRGFTDVEIPEDYARYLMGKSSKPSGVSFAYPVSLSEYRKGSMTRYNIVNTPIDEDISFTHKSKNGFWLGLAGVFDWLCVDLPVTCVENSLAIAGCCAVAPFAMLADLHETGEKIRKEREAAIRAQEAAERQQLLARQQARAQAVASGAAYYATCARCGGSGSIRYKVTTYQEMDRYEKMAEDKLRSSNFGFLARRRKRGGSTESDIPDGYKRTGESIRSEVCPDCGGSGQVLLRN